MSVKYTGLQASEGFHDTIFVRHTGTHGNKERLLTKDQCTEQAEVVVK
jgi:hypothetical protein